MPHSAQIRYRQFCSLRPDSIGQMVSFQWHRLRPGEDMSLKVVCPSPAPTALPTRPAQQSVAATSLISQSHLPLVAGGYRRSGPWGRRHVLQPSAGHRLDRGCCPRAAPAPPACESLSRRAGPLDRGSGTCPADIYLNERRRPDEPWSRASADRVISAFFGRDLAGDQGPFYPSTCSMVATGM